MTTPSLNPALENLLRHRRLPWLVLALILAVFGLAIGQVTQRMRRSVQQQILNRDAEVLRAMVWAQFAEVGSEIRAEVREPVDQWTVLLNASRARGVLAARLFDTNGVFDTAMPLDVTEGKMNAADCRRVLSSETVTHFRPEVPRGELYLGSGLEVGSQNTLPLLEVNVPLQARAGAEVVGLGQFVLEGESVAREFAALDRSLFTQAAVVFFAGGAIIALNVGWTFHRLQFKHRQLVERTRDLLRANEELAMAARTSAIGSITAHLIHGLKNPLSGLHQFVHGRNARPDNADDSLWRDAVASTRRMQQMVAEVVRVLREDAQGDTYELSLAELGESIRRRVEASLREAGVSLRVTCSGDGELDNRQANLVSLILTNLVQNATQASARGAEIMLELAAEESRLHFRVRDQGAGLPEAIRENLFAPCQSTREGGTGIGLAISKQLAGHLGADLLLERSTPDGSSFLLELPLRQVPVNSPLDEPVLRS